MALFIISLVAFVAALVLFFRAEDNDFRKFKEITAILQKELSAVNEKLDQMKEENKKLRLDIDAAHDQADNAKSKAETAESLAHKVAVDIAKKPVQAIQTQSQGPIKVEPIRVIVYDKRELQQKTKKVKQDANKTK